MPRVQWVPLVERGQMAQLGHPELTERMALTVVRARVEQAEQRAQQAQAVPTPRMEIRGQQDRQDPRERAA